MWFVECECVCLCIYGGGVGIYGLLLFGHWVNVKDGRWRFAVSVGGDF